MDDPTDDKPAPSGSGFVRLFDWLDETLSRYIGTAQLGPYGTVVKQVGEAVCPVCGHPMAEHTIDHTNLNAVLHCPAEHIPKPDPRGERISELGMPT